MLWSEIGKFEKVRGVVWSNLFVKGDDDAYGAEMQ